MTRPVRPGYLKNLFPAAAPAGNTDPYFANVVLLAGNESGADGTTTFLDQSSYARTLTAVGNAQWDTDTAPTGMTSSLKCDGAGDYLTMASVAELLFGTGDFTMEVWFRSEVTTSYKSVYGKWNNEQCLFGISETAQKFGFAWAPNGTANMIVKDPNTFTLSTWYCYAVTKASGTFRLYRDGTRVHENTPSNLSDGGTTAPNIGAYNAGVNGNWNGWIGPVRITKGVARYTGASYSVPSLPLPTS